MRLLRAGILTCGVGATILACGGADPQDVLGPTATPTPSSTATASGGTSGSSGSSGTSGSSGSNDIPDVPAVDAGRPACVDEREPNNGRDEANPLAVATCGVLKPESEADWLTFMLPTTATSLQIVFDGKVTLKVEIEDGPTVTLGSGTTVKVPVAKGRRYWVEIKSADGTKADTVPWRVDLVVEK